MDKLRVVGKESGGVPVEWVAQQLAFVVAHYPSFELPKASAAVFLSGMGEIVHIVGQERAYQGFVAAVNSCRFFPSMAELRAAAGLDPVKLFAVQVDRAWRLASKYSLKWHGGFRLPAGFRPDVLNHEDAVCLWRRKKLPLRIAYAVEQAGGLDCLVGGEDLKDSVFARQRFEAGYERYPLSEFSTPETLNPFADGVTEDVLLAGVLEDAAGNPLQEDIERVSCEEYWRRDDERKRREREERLARRTPEEIAADEEQKRKADAFLRSCERKVARPEPRLPDAKWVGGVFGDPEFEGKTVNQADPDGVPV